MYFKGNRKINKIMESSRGIDTSFEIKSNNLDYLFNQKIVRVNDTYLIENAGDSISIESIKKNYDDLIRLNTDKTGFECSINEIKLLNNFENKKFNLSSEQQFVLGGIVMKNLITKKNFPVPCVVYFTYDDGQLSMRFHKFRSNDGLWISDNLEDYEEPVGYYFIDSL